MKLISVVYKSNWQTKSSAIRFDSRQKLSEIASKTLRDCRIVVIKLQRKTLTIRLLQFLFLILDCLVKEVEEEAHGFVCGNGEVDVAAKVLGQLEACGCRPCCHIQSRLFPQESPWSRLRVLLCQ